VVCLTDCDHEAWTKSGRVPLGVLRHGGKKESKLYGVIHRFTFTDVYLVGIIL